MPQVFSAGWLYLFIIVMLISVVRIYFKIKTIQREAPMDRPVLKVAPIPLTEPDPGGGSGEESFLAGPDDLIRQGDYNGALGSLEKLLEDLSPTEDREARGKTLFRIGACHSRLATDGETFQHLLRAGEALREAVRLFTPARFLNHYLRALGELAALYEDLARERNPVEHLTQSARTCETGAISAGQGGLSGPEAIFLARSGNAFRQLASHREPQVNLRKAADAFEKAAAILESVDSENAASERIKILKLVGDTHVDLAEFFQKTESLARAVSAYRDALQLMDQKLYLRERCVVQTDAGRALVKLYDNEKDPAHLRQAMGLTRDAIQAAKGEDYQTQKGMTMAVMGDALSRYSEVKDRRDNLVRAVRLYEASLEILKDGEEPEEQERVKRRLAETLGEITGVGEGANGREGEGT